MYQQLVTTGCVARPHGLEPWFGPYNTFPACHGADAHTCTYLHTPARVRRTPGRPPARPPRRHPWGQNTHPAK